MYMDAQARPSNAQSLVSGIGTVVSTDSIDLLSAIDNPGRGGTPLRVVANITTAVVGAGSSVQAQLVSSANSNLSSPTVLASGPVTPVASAGAGAKLLDVPMPDVGQQYLGLQYLVTGAAITAGAVTAGVVGGSDRNSTAVPMNLGL